MRSGATRTEDSDTPGRRAPWRAIFATRPDPETCMSNRAAPFAPALAVALLAAGALAPQPAAALRVVAQATAICQGALPAFETQIRKRPLALQNEGEANAFVTCSFNNPGQNSGGTRISG